MHSIKRKASKMLEGRRPDFVRKTMQEPRRGAQLGPDHLTKMCLEEELYCR